MFGTTEPDGKVITIFFLTASQKITVKTAIGASLLQVAQEHGLDIEGACEGNMACATCHMIFDRKDFAALPALSNEEEEMLDLAVGLKVTSRLGCQIIVKPEMEGWVIKIPSETGAILGF